MVTKYSTVYHVYRHLLSNCTALRVSYCSTIRGRIELIMEMNKEVMNTYNIDSTLGDYVLIRNHRVK